LLRDALTKDPGNRRAVAMVLRQVESEALRADALDVLRQRLDASPLEAPFDLLVSRRLGIAALDAGQPREAERRLSQAVAADANDPTSQFHLARALESNSTGDPLPHFRKAFELDPTNTEFALTLADRLETAGQYDDAIAVYERALKSAEDNPDLLAASSWAMYKAGADKNVALERARRAAGLKPGVPKYQHALAVTLIWNGSGEEASELLKQAVAADMDYTVGLLSKYESQGEFELIGTLYDLLLAVHPDHAGILNNSAWSDYSLRRRPDRALQRAERAVQIGPNVPPFRVTLAAILIWQERPADAIAHLQHALRVDARSGSAHYYLGVAQQATGDTAGAASSFRSAVGYAGDPPADWLEDARKRLDELSAGGR
jgi:tetratricopeptide (TPR) repeat protein